MNDDNNNDDNDWLLAWIFDLPLGALVFETEQDNEDLRFIPIVPASTINSKSLEFCGHSKFGKGKWNND